MAKTRGQKRTRKRKHARDRAYERFGIVLDNDDIEFIRKSIIERQATFLGRRCHNTSLWLVHIRGTTMIAVFSSDYDIVSSFYHLHWIDSCRLSRRETPVDITFTSLSPLLSNERDQHEDTLPI